MPKQKLVKRDKPKAGVAAVTDKPSSGMGSPLQSVMDSGTRNLREELEVTKAELEEARKKLDLKATLLSDDPNFAVFVRPGVFLIDVEPNQIIDEVGSDRTVETGDREKFEKLRDDISQRTQTTPIRVRPRDPNWTPDEAGSEFLLQSGRRRLQACKDLNLKVLALVTAVTNEDDLHLEDLLERFQENSMREDLSGFERYISIGEIAACLEDLDQDGVGEKIGVNRTEVSVGTSVYNLKQDLVDYAGDAVKGYSKNQLRPLISKVKKWIEAGRPDLTDVEKPVRITATREPGRAVLSNGLTASLSRSGSIKVEMADGTKPSSDQLEWILDAIAKGAGRVTEKT